MAGASSLAGRPAVRAVRGPFMSPRATAPAYHFGWGPSPRGVVGPAGAPISESEHVPSTIKSRYNNDLLVRPYQQLSYVNEREMK